jgi:NADPH:quinone reductase-like Zn-dependent oxidoreductase
MTHPLLVHIAGEDGYTPPDSRQRVIKALEHQPMITVHVYPGRDHAFARPRAASTTTPPTPPWPTSAAWRSSRRICVMLAIQAVRTGGPEVLEAIEVEVPSPAAGQILVRHQAVGLNYIDTYHRSGLYPLKMPMVIGLEAAGVVEAIGDGVTRFQVGDRVAYNGTMGAYSEAAVVPAERAVKVPQGVSLETAAAVLLKGMTAEFLVRRCFHVKQGDLVLVHAAAGGVGQILVQWCKALGATVIATAGGEAKLALARELGADHAIDYGHEDVAARVAEITGGKGVAVVLPDNKKGGPRENRGPFLVLNSLED